MSFILIICEFLIASIYYFYNQEKKVFLKFKILCDNIKEKLEGEYLAISFPPVCILSCTCDHGVQTVLSDNLSQSLSVFLSSQRSVVGRMYGNFDHGLYCWLVMVPLSVAVTGSV